MWIDLLVEIPVDLEGWVERVMMVDSSVIHIPLFEFAAPECNRVGESHRPAEMEAKKLPDGCTEPCSDQRHLLASEAASGIVASDVAAAGVDEVAELRRFSEGQHGE